MTTTVKNVVLALSLGLAVALGSYAMRFDHNAMRVRAEQQQQAARLFNCTAHGGPSGIVITSDNTEVTLRRDSTTEQGLSWRLIAPINAPADDAIVEGFIATVCDATSLGSIEAKPSEPPLDLVSFHLQPQRFRLGLIFDDGTKQQLDVGDSSVFNNKLYVRRVLNDTPNQKPETTDAALAHHLQREVMGWRQKRPLYDVRANDFDHVQVSFADGSNYVLLQENPGVFTVAADHTAPLPADPIKVREWQSAILDCRAEQFVSDAPDDNARKRFALGKPEATITLTARGKISRRLLVGRLKLGKQEHLFAQLGDKNGPIMRLASNSLWQTLRQGPQALEDLHVLHIAANDVRGLMITSHWGSIQLHQRDGDQKGLINWQRTASDGRGPDAPIDNKALGMALGRLVNMRAARIITRDATLPALKEAGLVSPERTIALYAEKDRPLATLWLGQEKDGQMLVTDDKKKIIWSVFDDTPHAFVGVANPFAIEHAEAY